MRLILAAFNKVFGLRGEISFLPKSPTILYAPNIAGKTNVITAIRMCFLGHKMFRKLTKDEAIIKPLQDGSVVCYFSQGNRIYRLLYSFKRQQDSVRRSCKLESTDMLEFRSDLNPKKLRRSLEALAWKKEASGPRDIRKRLEQIEIYPEIMDILLASSNIDGYLRAIDGDVCKIPEVLSKQLTDTKNEANLNIKRLEKVRDRIAVVEDELRDYIKKQKKLLKKIGVEKDKIKKLHAGKVAEKLDDYEKQINKRLTRGIPEDKQRAMLAANALKPLRKKLEAIDDLKESIEQEETFDDLVKQVNEYREASEQWQQISSGIKSLPNDAWSLDTYSISGTRKFDFTVFEDSSDVEGILKVAKRFQQRMKTVKRMLQKQGIDSQGELKRNIHELSRAIRQFKKPKELPTDAVSAYVCPSPERRLPSISIPIDRYEPELAKVSSVTVVHIPKGLPAATKQKMKKHIERLEKTTKSLNTYLDLVEEVQNEIERIRKTRKGLLKLKEDELNRKISDLKEKISIIQKEWNGNATVLYKHFSLGPMRIKFDEETYEKDLERISDDMDECNENLREEIKKILKRFPRLRSKLLKKLEPKNFEAVARNLSKRVAKLENERRKTTLIQKWLQKEKENVKEACHDLRCSRILMKKIIPFAQAFYSLADQLINLEKMIEDLGNEMEQNVETSYRSIFAEPTFSFKHIGKGEFIPQLGDEQITIPSGSQSAAVSFGILYTLADQFGLPLIMDEAADRFDPMRLENFLELTKSATGTDGKQVCLAIFETRNLTAKQLLTFNTYECVRVSNTKKRVRQYRQTNP